MEWLNPWGLLFMGVIMIPNVVFALKRKDGFTDPYENRFVEALEQIGRFGCFAFMIIHVPGTWFGWWSDEAFAVYLIGSAALSAVYCAMWVVLWRRNGVVRALALSVLPAALFLFSGVMSRSIPLLASAALFAPCHIFISYKNAKLAAEQ
ncbi:MAG: hypothetical protein VB092_07605 [Oscillospiraceae bacterium]|nr:hypothetical protein [Oscillospiraceae bacterium]